MNDMERLDEMILKEKIRKLTQENKDLMDEVIIQDDVIVKLNKRIEELEHKYEYEEY